MHLSLLDIDWRFFNTRLFGEPVANYLWFAGIIIATLLLKKPVAKLLARISNKVTEQLSHARSQHNMQSMVWVPLERVLQTVLFYIALNQLSDLLDNLAVHHYVGKTRVTIRLGEVVDHVFLFLFIIFFAQTVSRVLSFIFNIELDKANTSQNRARQQLLPLMNEMAKLILWTLCTFWIMGSVFHVNIPALITGLGIGGVAIALAGKTTVENLFAAFTILTDKPFQTGETIKLADIEGTVERIGFRSTRLRGTDGAAYIIPNQNLIGNNLVNLSQRNTRGIKVTVSIKNGLPHDKLQQVLDELNATIKATPPVISPTDVTLDAFGEDSFQVVVSYHLPNPLPGGADLQDIKQRINLKIYETVTRHTAKTDVAIKSE